MNDTVLRRKDLSRQSIKMKVVNATGIRYQVSGILILPGEPLANGYCKWHPEKKGKNT